jgi:hypothetical protein
MGFLKKIFRGGKKKDKNGEVPATTSPPPVAAATVSASNKASARQPWNSKGKDRRSAASSAAASTTSSSVASLRSPRGAGAPVCVDDDGMVDDRQGSFTNNTYTGSSSSREREIELLANGGGSGVVSPRYQTQEQLRIAYEMSRAKKVSPTQRSHDENLDPTNVGTAGGGSDSMSPRLTTNHLQQWDRQSNGISPITGAGATSSSRPVYTMSSELPGQQAQAMDDMNRSDASSSSFNLSTDAEDSEYEMLKRRGGYPGVHNSSTLDTSAIETVTSYTTDEDRKIFPNLPTDDEMTQGTEPSQKESQPRSLLMPLQTPDDEPGRIHIFAQQNETFDDFKAWAMIAGGHEPPTTKSSTSRDHHFFPAGGGGVNNAVTNTSVTEAKKRGTPTAGSTSHSASRNNPGATHRNFTSPKSQASTATDFSPKEFGNEFPDTGFGTDFNDFGDFADFSNFPSTGEASGWKEEKKVQLWEETQELKRSIPSATSAMAVHSSPWMAASSAGAESMATTSNPNTSIVSSSNKIGDTSRGSGFDDPFEHSTLATSQASLSSSGIPQDTSLSELLEAAKNKRRGGRSNRINNRPTSSSVNSAPAITAAYLRQHHNLGGRYGAGNYNNTSGGSISDRDKGGDGTSVSDIIESLEATNRMKRGGQIYAHRSVGDTGAVATARAAKERLREKRRREREQGIHNSRSTELSDSEESDHEASESWLFDEVTGALGPRGIAADLESLSGRSNRSKNSHGNKSHKSSRRKSSSRKSSSRRPRSDRSVDSHGSRQSRNSRYSHRSTKSFLSQMSEQSRSVANDLLRLEMQLAMVGSQEKRDDVAARTGSSSASLGGASRGTSRSVGRKSLNTTRNAQTSAISVSTSTIARRTKISVIAPPGKLGIILANKADSKGTVVSGVRTSSVLVDRISPGDRIVAIDGEDVSRMTVSEITTIMSRKAEYERRLTVLTVPKAGNSPSEGMRSPSNSNRMMSDFDNFSSNAFRR